MDGMTQEHLDTAVKAGDSKHGSRWYLDSDDSMDWYVRRYAMTEHGLARIQHGEAWSVEEAQTQVRALNTELDASRH